MTVIKLVVLSPGALPLILLKVLGSSLPGPAWWGGRPGLLGSQGRASLCPVYSEILDKVLLRSCWLSQDPSCLRK